MNDASTPHDGDFVDKVLRQFDHALDVVHDKVLRPILLAGRVIAYGFIVVLAALVLIAVLLIGVIRFVNVYLFAGHEYITYLSVGAIAILAGMIIWRRRRPVNLRK
jgi:phosphatidylglycerophosphate synthase